MSGEPYPEKIQACIKSWKKNMGDWEIMLWDAQRFDVSMTHWTEQAFAAKKYAFVADYVRFYALYNYGGVYLDSDVEVIKSLNDFTDCDCFFGYEYSGCPEAAVVGSAPQQAWLKNALDWYEATSFLKSDDTYNIVVAPLVFRYAFEKETGIRLDGSNPYELRVDNQTIRILPEAYFSPKDGYTGKIRSTKNTYTIHHFSAAWKQNTLKNRLNKGIHASFKRIIGKKLFYKIMYGIRSKRICLLLASAGGKPMSELQRTSDKERLHNACKK